MPQYSTLDDGWVVFGWPFSPCSIEAKFTEVTQPTTCEFVIYEA